MAGRGPLDPAVKVRILAPQLGDMMKTDHWWNHRVVRREHKKANGLKEITLAIHEVHYNGKVSTKSGRVRVKPNSITTDPIDVVGENIEELRETLQRMLRSLDQPILEYDDF